MVSATATGRMSGKAGRGVVKDVAPSSQETLVCVESVWIDQFFFASRKSVRKAANARQEFHSIKNAEPV